MEATSRLVGASLLLCLLLLGLLPLGLAAWRHCPALKLAGQHKLCGMIWAKMLFCMPNWSVGVNTWPVALLMCQVLVRHHRCTGC